MRTSKVAVFVVGYALLLLTYALVAYRTQPGASLPSSAPLGSFSAERAISTLRRVLGPGERPHPMGSEANAAVSERIVEVLREEGYTPEIVEAPVCGQSGMCGRARDILVRGDEGWPRILIAAHYDSVPAGPGAADDGAGVATLLELSRALAKGAPVVGRPWFLFTDGEEVDLLGAELFVRKNVARFDFTLNLDARGTGGPVLMFQTNPESAQAVRWYAEASRHPIASSLLQSIYALLPNGTDFTVLNRGGEAGLNFAFIGHPLRYHTTVDRVDALDPRSVQHQGQQLLDLLSTPPPRAAGGRLVYFDVLAWTVVAWSEGWNAVLAVVALLACVAGAWRLGAGRRAFVHAALTWVSIPLLGGLAWALVALHRTPWAAEPAGFEAAALSFGVLGAVAVSHLAAKWVAPADAWAGTWVSFALLGVACHFVLPGASFLFVVPALVAGLSMAAATPRLRGYAFALGSVAAVLVLAPPARYVYDGLGKEGLCVLAMIAAIAAFTSSPFWVMGAREPGHRATGLLLPAAALLVAIFAGWRAHRVDARDPAAVWRMARLNPSKPASWYVGAFSPSFAQGTAPALEAATELPTTEPPLPWQDPAFYVDTGKLAPAQEARAPGASARLDPGRVTIEAKPHPSRLEFSIWLPKDSKAEVRMDGELARPYAEGGSLRATWTGGSPASITVTLPLEGTPAKGIYVSELYSCEAESVCAGAPPLPEGTTDSQLGSAIEIVHRLDELAR